MTVNRSWLPRVKGVIKIVACSITKTFEKQKVYYDPELDDEVQDDFEVGEAVMVNPDPPSLVDENFGTLRISPYTYQGLFEFSIIYMLAKLPNDGWLGQSECGILYPQGLLQAADILECAAKKIDDHVRDVLCSTQISPKQIQYRMKLQPEEVRKGLGELAAFCRSAAEKGYAVQLCL